MSVEKGIPTARAGWFSGVMTPDTHVRDEVPARASADERRPRWSGSARSLAAMGSITLLLSVAQVVGFGAFVVLAFGNMIGLAALGLLFVLTGVGAAALMKVTTGRAHPIAAGFVTLATVVMLAVAIGWAGSTPLPWIPPGFGGGYLLVAGIASLMLGLFLGPLWLRIVGGAVLIAVVIVIVWHGIATDAAEQAQVDSVAQAQRDANFEVFLDSGVHPMVAELPGADVARIVADGGPAQSWTVTADGGVVQIDVNALPPDMTDAYPCWWLAEPNSPLETTDTLEDYVHFCVRDADGWARPDGTGFVRIEGDRMIAVVGAYDENMQLPGALRPADAKEVAAAVAARRWLTEAELRETVGESWLSGTF